MPLIKKKIKLLKPDYIGLYSISNKTMTKTPFGYDWFNGTGRKYTPICVVLYRDGVGLYRVVLAEDNVDSKIWKMPYVERMACDLEVVDVSAG